MAGSVTRIELQSQRICADIDQAFPTPRTPERCDYSDKRATGTSTYRHCGDLQEDLVRGCTREVVDSLVLEPPVLIGAQFRAQHHAEHPLRC